MSKSKCETKCSKEVLNELKKRSNEITLRKKREIMSERRKNVEFKMKENEKIKNKRTDQDFKFITYLIEP